MKNAFYFMLKAKNELMRKIRLTSKFMTLQTGKQIIAIYILPNISRSKGNLIMTFGQLIEYNIGNIFLENSYKSDGEASPRGFHTKPKLSISLDTLCFYCKSKSTLPKYIKTEVLTTCFYLIKSSFKKQKKV